MILSPVKMCRQPAIWPSTTKYLLLTSHLSDLYSGRRPLQLRPLLPITIVSLPTTQKHFDWAGFFYVKHEGQSYYYHLRSTVKLRMNFFCAGLLFKRDSFPDNCIDWTNENVSFGTRNYECLSKECSTFAHV